MLPDELPHDPTSFINVDDAVIKSLGPSQGTFQAFMSAYSRQRAPRVDMILYHYTNAEGLYGIITSQMLRATHYLFLNDPTEGSYISRLIASSATGIADSEPFVADHLNGVAQALSKPRLQSVGVTQGEAAYIFALSRRDDSLAQWRGYAGTDGFALGFDSDSLINEPPSQRLVEVNYDSTEQQMRVDAELVPALSHFRLLEQGTFGGRGTMMGTTMKLIALAAEIKDPLYSEEGEWRIIVNPDPYTVRVRQSMSRIVPYTEIRFAPAALREIVVGPSADFDRAQYALWFLQNQFSALDFRFEVRRSNVPFR